MSNLILQQDNITLLTKSAPQIYQDNITSHQRCTAACQQLLEQIQQEGMTPDNDKKAQLYIEKSRKTVKVMNEAREPITKLFDQIRKEFTTLENDINPRTVGSLPYQLQQHRDQYAATLKAKADEERRQAQLLALEQRQAEQQRLNTENTLRQFALEQQRIKTQQLFDIFESLTLDNQKEVKDQLNQTITPLDFPKLKGDADYINNLKADLNNAYIKQTTATKLDLLEKIPSKIVELEKLATLQAEEAQRQAQAIRQQEQLDKQRAEEALQQQEQQQLAAQQAAEKAAQVNALFTAAAAQTPSYTPNTKIKKRLVPLNVEAFPNIIMTWWESEGATLSVEQLAKLFKKQITYCEKLANQQDNPIFIHSEHITYEDEITAK